METLKSITVNGNTQNIASERLTYEEVAELAGRPGDTSLTVVYHGRIKIDGERYEKNGSLVPGESVKIFDGLHFTAAHTGNA